MAFERWAWRGTMVRRVRARSMAAARDELLCWERYTGEDKSKPGGLNDGPAVQVRVGVCTGPELRAVLTSGGRGSPLHGPLRQSLGAGSRSIGTKDHPPP